MNEPGISAEVRENLMVDVSSLATIVTKLRPGHGHVQGSLDLAASWKLKHAPVAACGRWQFERPPRLSGAMLNPVGEPL